MRLNADSFAVGKEYQMGGVAYLVVAGADVSKGCQAWWFNGAGFFKRYVNHGPGDQCGVNQCVLDHGAVISLDAPSMFVRRAVPIDSPATPAELKDLGVKE